MKVAEWFQRYPNQAITVSGNLSLNKIAKQMLEHSVRDLYVVDDQQCVLGHIAHKKLAHLLLAEHKPTHTRSQIMERVAVSNCAEDIMETHFVCALPNEQLDNTINRMLEHDIEDMAIVTESGTLLGGINLSDILKNLHRRP